MQAELENAHKEIPELRLYDYGIEQAGGTIKDDKVAETRTQIIFWKLQQMIEQQGGPEIPPPTGAASQAKPDLQMPKAAPEKIMNEQGRRQGLEQQEQGQKSQRGVQ
jgi:hypothetical protein